jgi:predicted amidophosphoribosyltransferase
MRYVMPNGLEHRPGERLRHLLAIMRRRAWARTTCVSCGAPIATNGPRCARCVEAIESEIDPYLDLGCGD